MRGRIHYLTGACAWPAVCALAGPPRLIPLASGTLISAMSALAADLDSVGSTAARSAGVLTVGLAHGIRWLSGGHRKGTHSLLGTAMVAALFAAFTLAGGWPWWITAAVVTGYVTHIAGDMLTWHGCPLLYPWISQCYWLLPLRLRISTGGRGWTQQMRDSTRRRGHGQPFGEWIVSCLAVTVAAGLAWLLWVPR